MLSKVLKSASLSSLLTRRINSGVCSSVRALSCGSVAPSSFNKQHTYRFQKYTRYFSSQEIKLGSANEEVKSSSPRVSSNVETLNFQAETKKLLDIVTHSIYTDKEVFLRELISNASDALEKYRYYQATGQIPGVDGGTVTSNPLEIHIITNPSSNTLTLVDNGIGMTRDELVSNLGTIARSGSKAFVEQLSKSTSESGSAASSSSKEGIIGQFGVGFYSSFMVSDSVSVESISAQQSSSCSPHKWSSDGSGMFQISSESSIDG
jgi:TNF receptor-associated protein 1